MGAMKLPAALLEVLQALRLIGRPRLVGGCVRDWLLGDSPKDFDVEVPGVSFEQLHTALAPFGGTSPAMTEFARYLRQNGLYTFVRWHTFFTNPPLCISEGELREGFAVIDRALDLADRHVQ